MAATRLIALHINKGKTIAQCLNERLDYSQNPIKTEKGELITSYACDPETAAMEFLLSKRQYQQVTGQEYEGNIIAYQIRQSFKPGEINPEEANKLGYELAMRFTKGNHAFTVSTHTDRAHIHNHIIFNSTRILSNAQIRRECESEEEYLERVSASEKFLTERVAMNLNRLLSDERLAIDIKTTRELFGLMGAESGLMGNIFL